MNYIIHLREVQYCWAKAHIVFPQENIVDATHHTVCAKRNLVLCPLLRNDVDLTVK